MGHELEQKIRLRAYDIWEREGCSGRAEDHWLQAERELAATGTDQPTASADQAQEPASTNQAEAVAESDPAPLAKREGKNGERTTSRQRAYK
jgi:hypothetical protein